MTTSVTPYRNVSEFNNDLEQAARSGGEFTTEEAITIAARIPKSFSPADVATVTRRLDALTVSKKDPNRDAVFIVKQALNPQSRDAQLFQARFTIPMAKALQTGKKGDKIDPGVSTSEMALVASSIPTELRTNIYGMRVAGITGTLYDEGRMVDPSKLQTAFTPPKSVPLPAIANFTNSLDKLRQNFYALLKTPRNVQAFIAFVQKDRVTRSELAMVRHLVGLYGQLDPTTRQILNAFITRNPCDTHDPSIVQRIGVSDPTIDPAQAKKRTRYAATAPIDALSSASRWDNGKQGNIGTCAVISSTLGITSDSIFSTTRGGNNVLNDNMFVDGNGTLQVAFYKPDGNVAYVTVDAGLPTKKDGTLSYAQGGLMGLYEKAYAKFKGGSYTSVDGNISSEVMFAMTGITTEIVPAPRVVTWEFLTSQTGPLILGSKASADMNTSITQRVKGNPSTAAEWAKYTGTYTPGNQYGYNGDLVEGHAYVFKGTKIVNGRKFVVLQNPWQESSAVAKGGVFEIPLELAQAVFRGGSRFEPAALQRFIRSRKSVA